MGKVKSIFKGEVTQLVHQSYYWIAEFSPTVLLNVAQSCFQRSDRSYTLADTNWTGGNVMSTKFVTDAVYVEFIDGDKDFLSACVLDLTLNSIMNFLRIPVSIITRDEASMSRLRAWWALVDAWDKENPNASEAEQEKSRPRRPAMPGELHIPILIREDERFAVEVTPCERPKTATRFRIYLDGIQSRPTV